MTPAVKRALGLALLVAVYLALRLPALLLDAPTQDEWAWIGAGQTLVHDGPAAVAALEHAPPLTAHVTSIATWFVVEDPEATLLSDSAAARVLYRSWWTGGTTPADGWTVLLLVRLPVLLAGLFGMDLLRRTGRRLFDEGTGWIAAAAWALHPIAAGSSVRATPDVLAAVAGLFLFVSFVDYHDVSARRGRPASLRSWRLGIAAGIALAARHVLLVPVLVLVIAGPWLRARRRRRDEEFLTGALPRFARIAVVAVLVFWALQWFEIGPLQGATLPPAAAGVADLLGLDAGALQRGLATTTAPFATYVQSLLLLLGAAGRGVPEAALAPDGYGTGLVATTPLVLLAFSAAGLAGWWQLRRDRADLPDLTLALALALLVAPALAGDPVGPEHALPALPFLLLLGGAALRRLTLARPRATALVVTGAALLLVAEVAPHAAAPAAFRHVLAPDRPAADPDDVVPPPGSPDRGQDLWRVLAWCDDRGVDDLVTVLGAPQEVLAYEARRRPFLWSPRAGTSGLAALARSIRAEDQPHGSDERRLLAASDDALRHPALARLRDVEPLITLGRARLYRLPPPPPPADGLPAGAIPEGTRAPRDE